jgi:hypothetical protein
MTVRIAVIDSGVHAEHPHVRGVAGGVSFCGGDYVDRLGHGTCVAAAIKEKAPGAEIYAVKVFDRRLEAPFSFLLAGLNWAVEQRMHLINLSLGVTKPEHERALAELAVRAEGTLIVCPHALPGVLAAAADPACPRDQYRFRDGVFYASPYPRPIPGVPVEKNLHGLSFAVANMTGFAARVVEAQPVAGPRAWLEAASGAPHF